jgi:hypothetical protein
MEKDEEIEEKEQIKQDKECDFKMITLGIETIEN